LSVCGLHSLQCEGGWFLRGFQSIQCRRYLTLNDSADLW